VAFRPLNAGLQSMWLQPRAFHVRQLANLPFPRKPALSVAEGRKPTRHPFKKTAIRPPINPEREIMNLNCDLSLAANYHSASQQARVLSEGWFLKNVYCLACDADSVKQTSANTRATDFVCPKCSHRYELKAFQRRPHRSLVDGAFASMMQRVTSGTAPTLCLLERTEEWRVHSLTAIHSSFLIPEVVEKRPPLGPNARRSLSRKSRGSCQNENSYR